MTPLPFKAKTCTRKHHVSKVIADRGEGIFLRHGPDIAEFPLGLPSIISANEIYAFQWVEVGPVDAFRRVRIVRLEQVVENLSLIIAHYMDWIVSAAHIRSMRSGRSVVLDVSHDCLSDDWQGWRTLGSKNAWRISD